LDDRIDEPLGMLLRASLVARLYDRPNEFRRW
jgi:hypothetical protein